jgi:hypothetical protein
MVDSLVVEEGRPVGVRLRNPWGVDGAGNDGADDGYVDVSLADLTRGFWGMISARV